MAAKKKAATAKKVAKKEDDSAGGTPAPQAKQGAKFVAVSHLSEGGEYFKPGDPVPCTKERAAALGDSVRPAE